MKCPLSNYLRDLFLNETHSLLPKITCKADNDHLISGCLWLQSYVVQQSEARKRANQSLDKGSRELVPFSLSLQISPTYRQTKTSEKAFDIQFFIRRVSRIIILFASHIAQLWFPLPNVY